MTSRQFLTIAAVCAAGTNAYAIDGIAVTSANRYTENNDYKAQVPESEITDYNDSEYQPGKIIRIDIENNVPVSCDTIYKATFARFPVLNVDGTKIAFHRWSVRAEGSQLIDRDGPCYISVMDLDGGNVTDLVQYDNRQALLDWARENGEDWIYYTNKETYEIWKVKPGDPSSHTLACSYQSPRIDGFWRWDIAADGSRAMINPHFTDGGYTNVPHAFPFNTVPLPGGQGGSADDMISCNGCMSPSGKYVATFMVLGHGGSTIARWDPGVWHWDYNYTVTSLAEMSDSLGIEVGHAMEMHRWSANSDKWMVLAPTGGYQARWEGGNQALSNWVDREFIMTTHNEYIKTTDPGATIIHYTCLGDFWVAGGPPGCYEDTTGTWISVDNGEPVSNRAGHRESVRTVAGTRVVRTDAGIVLGIGGHGVHRVDLVGIDGRCVRSIRTAQSTLLLADRHMPSGVAFARIRSESTGNTRTVRVVR